MQDLRWDDLRIVLAVARHRRLAGAARALGINETTVARRLRAAEQAVSAPLFTREEAGTLVATSSGETVLGHAETVERSMIALADDLGAARARIAGHVRISAVPILANRVLVPRLAPLLAAHPDLVLDLVAEARNVDLRRREADLALRLARPGDGGLQVTARQIATLDFAVYGPVGQADSELPWIGYDDAHTHLPQAKWLRAVADDATSALRVSDADTALQAVANGLGNALLPVAAADHDPRLQRLTETNAAPPPSRPLWMLSNRDDAGRPAIEVVKTWLAGLLRAAAP